MTGLPARGGMHGWRTEIAGAGEWAQFEKDAATLGKGFAVVRIYREWNQGLGSAASSALAAGKLLMMSHKPPAQSAGGWGAVANGGQDGRINELADLYRAVGSEVIFIFHHEPHDDASDIGERDYGTAAQYVAAYRRIIEKFRARGATNVRFGYSASENRALTSPDRCYPGDDYIDLLCHDAYNWYEYAPSGKWRSFEKIWAPIVAVAKAHDKPLLIGEWGSHPGVDGYDRDQWFRDAATYLKTNADAQRHVIGFCVFHRLHDNDWRFLSGPHAHNGTQGYIDGFVSDPYFTSTPFPITLR